MWDRVQHVLAVLNTELPFGFAGDCSLGEGGQRGGRVNSSSTV